MPTDMLVIETLNMRLTDDPAVGVTAGTGDGDAGARVTVAGVETRPVFAFGDAVGRGPGTELGVRATLGPGVTFGARLTLGALVVLGARVTLRAEDELLEGTAAWKADGVGEEGRVARAAHVMATATTTAPATAALPGPMRRSAVLCQGTRSPAIRIRANPLISVGPRA